MAIIPAAEATLSGITSYEDLARDGLSNYAKYAQLLEKLDSLKRPCIESKLVDAMPDEVAVLEGRVHDCKREVNEIIDKIKHTASLLHKAAPASFSGVIAEFLRCASSVEPFYIEEDQEYTPEDVLLQDLKVSCLKGSSVPKSRKRIRFNDEQQIREYPCPGMTVAIPTKQYLSQPVDRTSIRSRPAHQVHARLAFPALQADSFLSDKRCCQTSAMCSRIAFANGIRDAIADNQLTIPGITEVDIDMYMQGEIDSFALDHTIPSVKAFWDAYQQGRDGTA